MTNITIFGCGNVGVTIAKELLDSGIKIKLNIIDIDTKVQALVNDLNAANSVVFVAFAQEATVIGDRLAKAKNHIDQVYEDFTKVNFKDSAQFIVISNPVDAIAYHIKEAITNKNVKIIGTGTYLETLRYHYMLSKHFNVEPNEASGFLLGEHGNSAVTILSKTKIKDKLLTEAQYDQATKAGEDAIEAPYIIRKMGHYTKFAIAKCAVSIFKAFYLKENLVCVAGVFLNKENQQLLGCGPLCFSTEAEIVNGELIQKNLSDLSEKEIDALKKSAQILTDYTINYLR